MQRQLVQWQKCPSNTIQLESKYSIQTYSIQGNGFTWGGALPKKWDMGCAALKTPFSRPPRCSQDSHFSIFQFSRPYFHPKITIFKINFKLQSLKINAEFSSKALIGSNFSSQGYILLEILFTRVPNLAVVHSQAPLFGPLDHTQNESWVPSLGGYDIFFLMCLMSKCKY